MYRLVAIKEDRAIFFISWFHGIKVSLKKMYLSSPFSLLVFLCSCHETFDPYDFSLTEVRAAIIQESRSLGLRDEVQKNPSHKSLSIDTKKMPPVCLKDNEEMQIVLIRQAPSFASDVYTEIGYYCRKERIFYYRYKNNQKGLDVILGPFKLEREKLKPFKPEERE